MRGEPGQPGAFAQRRAALFAVVLAALLPVLITVATRPAMYNGIRHFVFLTPPFAVLGGLAAAWIARRLQPYGRAAIAAAAALLIVGVASPIADMVRLHPYEYTDFNHIAGGVAGARPLYMLDYWGLSMRQASLKLREVLAERGENAIESNMAGRGVRSASGGRRRPWPAIFGDLETQRRRLRHDARRVLLRQARRPYSF